MKTLNKIQFWVKWFLIFFIFKLFSFLSAPIVVPFALLLKKLIPNYNPLWFWLDDSAYIYKNLEYAEDYGYWLNARGGKETFLNLYKWNGFRNTMWNLNQLIKPKCGRINGVKNNEIIIELKQNTLTRLGNKVDIDGLFYEEALLKFIDKNGNEGWQVWSGVKVSDTYSTIGVANYWYKLENSYYYRYSIAKKYFNKFWFEFRIGTSSCGYNLTLKLHFNK